MLVFGEKGKPEFRGGAGLLQQTERANKINSRLASSKDSILDPICGIFGIIEIIIEIFEIILFQISIFEIIIFVNIWNIG